MKRESMNQRRQVLREHILPLYNQGLSNSAIAKTLNVKYQVVRYCLRSLALPANVPESAVCGNCSIEFAPKQANQKCCSVTCGKNFNERKRYARIHPPNSKNCKCCKISIPNRNDYCDAKECHRRAAIKNSKKFRLKHYELVKAKDRQHKAIKRLEHPERVKQQAQMYHLKIRLRILSIIGSACLNHPDRIPEVDHIAESGYWSGAQHRNRLGGSSKVQFHLLRLHAKGKDITKIVQPLCRSCNISKRKKWEAKYRRKNNA